MKSKYWVDGTLLPALFDNMYRSRNQTQVIGDYYRIPALLHFDLPSELAMVKGTKKEDAKRPEILEFVRAKKEMLQTGIEEMFGTIVEDGWEEDIQFFSRPMYSHVMTVEDGKGFYRLRTEEEWKELAKESPALGLSIVDLTEALKDGFYEFDDTFPVTEQGIPFRMKKYSGIRVAFYFTLPVKKAEYIHAKQVRKIFDQTQYTRKSGPIRIEANAELVGELPAKNKSQSILLFEAEDGTRYEWRTSVKRTVPFGTRCTFNAQVSGLYWEGNSRVYQVTYVQDRVYEVAANEIKWLVNYVIKEEHQTSNGFVVLKVEQDENLQEQLVAKLDQIWPYDQFDEDADKFTSHRRKAELTITDKQKINAEEYAVLRKFNLC